MTRCTTVVSGITLVYINVWQYCCPYNLNIWLSLKSGQICCSFVQKFKVLVDLFKVTIVNGITGITLLQYYRVQALFNLDNFGLKFFGNSHINFHLNLEKKMKPYMQIFLYLYVLGVPPPVHFTHCCWWYYLNWLEPCWEETCLILIFIM